MHVSEVQVGDNLFIYFFFFQKVVKVTWTFIFLMIDMSKQDMYIEIVKVMWTCWGVYRLIKQNRTCIEISLIKKNEPVYIMSKTRH